MQRNIEFLLESAPNMATAMQRITGQLQAVAAGRTFVIQGMMAAPEMVPPGIGELQPRMQVTVVIAIEYTDSKEMPGMEDPTTVNQNAFEGLQQVKAAAKRAGLG